MKKRLDKIFNIIEQRLKKYDERKLCFFILVFFFVLAIIPIILPGILYGHDIFFHLSRVEGIAEGLKSGAFPVLVYPTYLSGYGYANGIFYPDLFLYIPALLRVIGLSNVASYEIFLILITLAIMGSMYFSVKKITKSNYAATIATVIYLMSSYRIADMWLRAALGETLTFIFLPLVMLGIYQIIYGDEKKWYYLTLGLIGVVLSHLLSSLICVILVGVFALCNIKKLFKEKKRLRNLLIAGSLAIGITLFFTLPLLEVMISDNFGYQGYNDGAMIASRALNPLFTILEIPFGQGMWIPGGIGIIFVYLTYRFFKAKIKDKQLNSFKKVCFIFSLVLLFMTTFLFPWNIFGKILGMIQFPWRFYLPITLMLIICFSLLIKEHIISFSSKVRFTTIIMLFSILTFGIQLVYNYHYGTVSERMTGEIVFGEYLPENVDKLALTRRGDVVTANHEITVNHKRNGTNISVDYQFNSTALTTIELPLIYYKGYVALDENNQPLEVYKSKDGLINIDLEQESGSIKVYYGITNIRKYSLLTSLVFIITFLLLITKTKKTPQ